MGSVQLLWKTGRKTPAIGEATGTGIPGTAAREDGAGTTKQRGTADWRNILDQLPKRKSGESKGEYLINHCGTHIIFANL